MIKSIWCPDSILNVSKSGQGGPYHSGAVHWDGNSQTMQVVSSDGAVHSMHGHDAHIIAGPQLANIMNWVYKKMAEDAELDKLCKAYPNLDEARQEFAVLHRLLKEHK
jgi:hypothetical protein